jgi:2-methylcitrate dehydratase
MGYCVARALLDGDVTRQSFADDKIRDPRGLTLLDKTKIVETDECNAGYPKGIPNKLIIKTADGRTLSKKVDYPRGHAGNPMTDEEVFAKFRKLAAGVVSESTARRIIDRCMRLDEQNDMRDLLEFETLK